MTKAMCYSCLHTGTQTWTVGECVSRTTKKMCYLHWKEVYGYDTCPDWEVWLKRGMKGIVAGLKAGEQK